MPFGGVIAASTLGLAAPDHARKHATAVSNSIKNVNTAKTIILDEVVMSELPSNN